MSQRRTTNQTKLIKRPAALERRAWVRYASCPYAASHVVDANTDVGWWAKIHDISAGGMAMSLNWRVKPGSILVLEKFGGAGRPNRTLAIRVAHISPDPAGGWFVGCEFVRPLTDADLEAFERPAEAVTVDCPPPPSAVYPIGRGGLGPL
jgi:hypothetical protein